MARLPIPGDDEGGWGEILNDFLLQVHTSDGALKSDSVGPSQLQDNAVTSASIADNSIPQSKIQNLSSDLAATEKTANKGVAGGYAPLDGSGKVPTANLPAGTSTPDATTTTNGIIRLAGDLGGTADAPTVPGLSTKANDTAVVHLAGTNTATLADSSIQFLRINIPDDGSSTSGWPDRLPFYFAGTRTGYHNEYGELRARPAKQNTVALRAMAHASGSSGDVFQVASSDSSSVYLGVSQTQVTTTVPVITPNLPQKITVSDTAPVSPQDGDIWFDTSGA